MKDKPLWLRITKYISIIGLTLSIIIGLYFTFFVEWGAMIAVGLALPIGLLFLGIWIVSSLTNYFINNEKKLIANIISIVLLIGSIVSIFILFNTRNLIVSAFYVF